MTKPQKIEGGWEAGKLIDWEEEFEEIAVDVEGCQKYGEDCGKKNRSGDFLCPICQRWGGKEKEPKYFKRPITTFKNISNFIHKTLLAQQAKTKKLVLEGMRIELIEKLELNKYVLVEVSKFTILSVLDDLSKLSEMEEHEL